jgi:hypothetical protein
MIESIWQDRNRVCGLPIGMSEYVLSKNRLHLTQGFLIRTVDEVNLRCVQGITVTRSLSQRLCGCGTVIVRLRNSPHEQFIFRNIKCPLEVAELIHQHSETAKDRYCKLINRKNRFLAIY